MKAQGVLGVAVAPAVIREALHYRQPDLEAGLVQLIREISGHPLGLGGTDVGRLEDPAQDALGRDRVALSELSIRGDHAAEVLAPPPLGAAVHVEWSVTFR